MRRRGADVLMSPKDCAISLLYLTDEGLSNKDVGMRLGCSENTVYVHAQSMFRGLDIGSRAQLVRWLDQHPRALLPEWSDWKTHPVGCVCLHLPYCAFARAELAREKLAA